MSALAKKLVSSRVLPWIGVLAGITVGVLAGSFLQPAATTEQPLDVAEAEGFSSSLEETTPFEKNNPVTAIADTQIDTSQQPTAATADLTNHAEQDLLADSEDSPLPKGSEPDNPIARLLLASDEWLRMGYFSRALSGFEVVLEHSEIRAVESVRFRIALCHEFLGDWSKAQQQYRELAKSIQFLEIRNLARLGEARCLITRGDTELLKSQYFPTAILNETAYSTRVNGELLHLIGRALVLDTKDRGPLWTAVKSEDSDDLAIPDMDYAPGKILDQLKTVQQEPDMSDLPVFQVLQRSVDTPDGCFVRMNQPKVGVRSLLTEMVTECGFQSQLSPDVSVAIQGHGQTVIVSDKSLSLLLDGICMRYGLVWTSSGTNISIVTREEADAAAALEFTRSQTERVLRWAILTSPDSTQAHSSQLLLGVMNFDRGQYAEASHVFQVYLERHPHTMLTGLAAFNLAKCYLQNGQYDEAEAAMLRGVDHTHSTLDTRIAAYMQLGRLRLETGNIKAALSTLVRGLSQSRGHKSEGDISLLLASAYLLADNPQAANSILMERRTLFKSSEQKETVAFLSSYCRLRRAADPARIARETRAVVSSLAYFRPGRMFGKHWYLLAAAAYEDMGLRDSAISTHIAALKDQLPEFVLAHCTVQLAELYIAEADYEKSQILLDAMPEISNEKLRHRALLSQTELAMRMENFEAAVGFASTIARESTDETTTREALKLLGQSYEKLQNFRAAVYCYAGMVPDTDIESIVEQVSHTTETEATERRQQ